MSTVLFRPLNFTLIFIEPIYYQRLKGAFNIIIKKHYHKVNFILIHTTTLHCQRVNIVYTYYNNSLPKDKRYVHILQQFTNKG